MRNRSCENKSRQEVHFHANQTYFHKNGFTLRLVFETEAQGNSEMLRVTFKPFVVVATVVVDDDDVLFFSFCFCLLLLLLLLMSFVCMFFFFLLLSLSFLDFSLDSVYFFCTLVLGSTNIFYYIPVKLSAISLFT